MTITLEPTDAARPNPTRPNRQAPAEDLEVAQRFARGGPEAFEECYRLLGPAVRGRVARSLPHHLVDDVTQRIFYEVWRSRERYDPSRSLRGWVFGIAHKRTIDELRKRRPGLFSLQSVAEIAGEDGRDWADRLGWAADLYAALDQLNPRERQAIEMAYFQGYTQSEISTAIDVPLGTVKSRSSRALKHLAAILGPRATPDACPNPGLVG